MEKTYKVFNLNHPDIYEMCGFIKKTSVKNESTSSIPQPPISNLVDGSEIRVSTSWGW